MKTFIKENPLPGSLSLHAEVTGLRLIESHFSSHGLKTPRILNFDQNSLSLQYIEAKQPSDSDFRALAKSLAALHRLTNPFFGFPQDGFIGLSPQQNSQSKNWGQFFLENRLRYQAQRIQNKQLRSEILADLNSYGSELVDFLNQHAPAASLVHGDLWSGNVLFSKDGPYLIDPACHYADREVDLGMTRIFGGFPRAFYEEYHHQYPLPSRSEERLSIYNLYH